MKEQPVTSERLKKEIAFLEFERPRMARWTDSDESLLRAYRELLTLREEREWIPVTDKDRPVGRDHLLLLEAEPDMNPVSVVGYFNRLTRKWCIGGVMIDRVVVTHYQPLPTPPKPRSES